MRIQHVLLTIWIVIRCQSSQCLSDRPTRPLTSCCPCPCTRSRSPCPVPHTPKTINHMFGRLLGGAIKKISAPFSPRKTNFFTKKNVCTITVAKRILLKNFLYKKMYPLKSKCFDMNVYKNSAKILKVKKNKKITLKMSCSPAAFDASFGIITLIFGVLTANFLINLNIINAPSLEVKWR